MRPPLTRLVLPLVSSRPSWVRAVVGAALLTGVVSGTRAQISGEPGEVIFPTGDTVRVGPYLTSVGTDVETVHFEVDATVNQQVVIDTADVAVTMNSGSAILPPLSTAYALRFTSTGGTLNATGATLRAGTTGVLNFTGSASAVFTDSVIDFTPSVASSAAAVLLQNGGTFTATGGSIAYNPSGALANFNYAFRNTAGTLALSLTNVEVTSGSTTSHRGYGIDLTGGGTVDLLGTTSVTSRQGEALRLSGAYTITNAGTLTALNASGNHADSAVRLTGGASTLTNTATGVINGDAAGFSAGGAIRLLTEATGSVINNAGVIDGIYAENTGGFLASVQLENSGTVAVTNRSAITLGGGAITNQVGGTISGGTSSNGILISGGDAGVGFDLTNTGEIAGGTAVFVSAGTINLTNQADASLTGTAVAGTAYGATLTSNGGSVTVNNAGTISGRQGVQITGQGDVAAVQNLAVTNTGTLTGSVNQGLRVDGEYAATAARNIVINNESGALIQGGTTTPGFFSITNAAVFASNRGDGVLTIDNRGTIDARNQTSAIGVSVYDNVQATITLHTGSTTTGAIRASNPNNSLNASTTLAFAGTGSYSGTTSGINRYLKADAGVWTYSGERTGGAMEVSAGTLVLSNRDLGSSTSTTVTNGTLRLSPASPMAMGNLSLNSNHLTVGTGGRLEIAATARASFGGSSGEQRIENAGVLLVDGVAHFVSGGAFAGRVTSNALLAGTGRLLGYVRFEDGGTLDAGNGNLASAGLLRTFESGGVVGDLTFGDGGILRWTLANLSETAPGVNFDQIGLDGTTAVTYEAGARLALDFSAFGDGPEAAETFWDSARSWDFVTGGTVNGGSNLLFAATGLATYAFEGIGTFSLNGDGRTLEWTPGSAVPEPSTWGAILGAVALAGVMLRRRGRI